MIIGSRSRKWKCLCPDARRVDKFGTCLFCTRKFCFGCENGAALFMFNIFFKFIYFIVCMHNAVITHVTLQYQNCLRKFYHNTDSQILLYLARTHYEAEQWQDCKKTLLRAIHLAPSNYTLRFDAGVAMQKFSASTLQKTKRTADEVV